MWPLTWLDNVRWRRSHSHLQLLQLWSSNEAMVVQEGCGTLQLSEAPITFNFVVQFVGDGSGNCREPLVDHVEGPERTRSNALRRPEPQSAQPHGKRRQFDSCIFGLIVPRWSSQQNLHGALHAGIMLLCILP